MWLGMSWIFIAILVGISMDRISPYAVMDLTVYELKITLTELWNVDTKGSRTHKI